MLYISALKMRKSALTTFTFLLTCLYSFSQDFSNKGKEFWVAYGYHQVMTANNSQDMVLYFATENATTVNVSIPSLGYSVSYNVPANTVFTSNPLPKAGAQDCRLLSESTTGENKGIHITSSQPIVAYAHIYNQSVSGATILFPTNTLGREYYSINYTNYSNTGDANCWAYVIAADTGITTVEITPSQPTINKPAGVPFTVTLTQGQVFNIMGKFTNGIPTNQGGTGGGLGVDLTGTLIKSINTGTGCKKIAVYSGSGRINIACNTLPFSTSSDNYMTQAFPKNAWGKRFLTATSAGNQSFNIYRICVSDPTASVLLNGSPIAVQLQNNFYYEIGPLSTPQKIESDKPITVAQYFTSQNRCGNGNLGDPEVIYLSPVEQNIDKVLFNSNLLVAATPQHFANVIIPNGGTAISSFRIDGAVPVNPFSVHPQDPNYSYIKISGLALGQHTMQSDSGFNAIAYGFANAESYGYNAGTNVIDLYQYVTTQNANATIKSPVACKSSPFILAITLPYIPLSLKWVITNYPTVINNSPIADSSFIVNGKTLYLFRLPTTYVYNSIGVYPVVVTANNPTPDGCTGEQIIDFNLEVFNPPAPDFTWPAVPASGCVDSVITFSTINNGNGRPVIRHFWDFGDNTYAYINNPAKIYSVAGTYKIRYAIMTDAGCLSDTIEKTISVTKTPVAKFGFTAPQCQGKQITFSDNSTLAGGFGSIVNWNWNLGVGSAINNGTNANVTATYPNSITYNPTLQVKTNTGCLSPVYTFPVSVHPNPVPDFTMSYACLPDGIVNFTNTSTIADGTQASFTHLWNFGDAVSGALNTSTVQNPAHKYSTVGPYSIQLKVSSNNGCVDSITKVQNNIYPQPKADFTSPIEVCWQTPVTFNSSTSNGFTHPVTKWEWRFSDGSSSTLQNPVKNFATPGTYTATLWVFTNQNCVSDTITKTVIVHPWPTANFNLSAPSCEKNQVSFTDNSTANVGNDVRWYWNLGDGTIVNANNNNPVTHTYTNWGNKTIKLLVENSKGCKSDTLTKTILVNPLPKIGYVLPEVCLSDANALFFDTTKMADNSAASLTYLWKFNTGATAIVPGPVPATSTLKNPVIKFNKSDNYLLSLTVTTKDGCVDSVVNIPFTVNGSIPKADFLSLPTNGLCSNQDVRIQDKSTVDFGAVTKVEIYWDNANNPTVFDTDDLPALNKIYAHRYPNFQSPLTKTFTIRYRAYSGVICVNDAVKTITVNASPLTQFLPMPGICLDAVPRQITEASELGAVPGTEIFSGPGVSSTGMFNPAAAGVGIHTIRYTYNATNGCTHYSEQTIEVWPRPVAKLNLQLPSCEKNNVLFNSIGSAHNATTLSNWSWDFGDASAIVNIANGNPVNHYYSVYGNYTVKLTVTNNRGCVSITEPLSIKVNPLPRVDFSLPKVCLPDGSGAFFDQSTIPDNTQAQFSYKWDFGVNGSNADTSVLKNPVYKYSNLGPYNVQLKVISNNSCVDSLTKTLVDVFPQPKAKFSSIDSICLGTVIDFTDQSDGIVRNITKWNWSFGDGRTSAIQNPRYLYTSGGNYHVKLIVYSSEGCISDTAQKTIDVWAFPAVDAGPDLTVLQDGIRKITDATATGSGLQFLWTPATYLDNVTLLNPTIIKPQDDITYLLTVTGRGRCINKDSVFVRILKMPKAPNTFTPNGDGFNDFWEIKSLSDYPGCVVEVYNTAGALVFRSVGYSTPWDGKWKGQPLPAGTYYYVIDPKNGRAKQAGYVTILR